MPVGPPVIVPVVPGLAVQVNPVGQVAVVTGVVTVQVYPAGQVADDVPPVMLPPALRTPRVRGPTKPVEGRLLDVWNCITAVFVCVPK